MDEQKNLFYNKLDQYYLVNRNAKQPWNHEEITKVARDILHAKQTGGKKTRRQYHLLSLYETVKVEDKHIVIKKRLKDSDNIIYVTPYEDLFEILYSMHITMGHGCRDKMIFGLKYKYQIPRPVIETFLQCCETCHKKKSGKHVNLVIQPRVSKEFSSRGIVDLIDFQTCQDGDYKWLLNYQDYFTKFFCLRPLKSKESAEVASELLKIFLDFGAPDVLESENGFEFVDSVLTELVKLWSELKFIRACTLPQGCIETSSHDVKRMLHTWMLDKNSTNWAVGCHFVQLDKNCSHDMDIGSSPYHVMFGMNPKTSINLQIDSDMV